jgi:hypothetical protein
MEAVRTSETSVDNYFTRQYIPEDNSELTCMICKQYVNMCIPDKYQDTWQTDPPSRQRGRHMTTHIQTYDFWSRVPEGASTPRLAYCRQLQSDLDT